MLSKFQRDLLRKKLQKKKFKILCELMDIKKNIEILDKLDEKDKKEKAEKKD